MLRISWYAGPVYPIGTRGTVPWPTKKTWPSKIMGITHAHTIMWLHSTIMQWYLIRDCILLKTGCCALAYEMLNLAQLILALLTGEVIGYKTPPICLEMFVPVKWHRSEQHSIGPLVSSLTMSRWAPVVNLGGLPLLCFTSSDFFGYPMLYSWSRNVYNPAYLSHCFTIWAPTQYTISHC